MTNPAEQQRQKQAHELYLGCKEILPGAFQGPLQDGAATSQEARFYTAVANFFLQEKQRELIEKGAF
jgi:hypothetical protein